MTLMAIEMLDPHAKDFPLGGSQAAAEAFVRFAVTKSSPIHSYSQDKSMYFLGTYWDEGSAKPKLLGGSAKISITNGTPILINPILAIISKDEHPDQFEEDDPPDQVVMNKTEKVIEGAEGTVLVEEKRDGNRQEYNVRDLQREKSRGGKKEKMHVKANWPTLRNKSEINACWDGRFLAIRGLEKGSYTITIDASSPLFGTKNPGERFVSQFKYELDVS
jgi:hypothetical protein